MPSEVTTLGRIAQLAGCSISTVSLALRGDLRVRAQTRERICRLAKSLDYRPNPLVSALMTYQRLGKPIDRGVNIAFITSDSMRSPWLSYRFDPGLYEGALDCAASRGLHLEEFWLTEPGMTPGRLDQVLRARNIHAAIIAPLPAPHGGPELDWPGLAAVALGYSLTEPPLHRVISHYFRSMRLALARITQHGYRRIGFFIEEEQDRRVEYQWSGAFVAAQLRLPPRDRVPILICAQLSKARRGFLQWLLKTRPDAILTGHPEEVLQWLGEEQISVPEELGVATLYHRRDRVGRMAGIDHNTALIGAAAVDFLSGMLQRNEYGVPPSPQTVLVECEWREGATLAKKPPTRE